MDIIFLFFLIALIVAALVVLKNVIGTPPNRTYEKVDSLDANELQNQTPSQYAYARKSNIMTPAEGHFFHRLTAIVTEKYYVFPQVHLSALAVNKTYGKYHKLGFQRINRRSVDYVLADKITLQPVYAIELDDKSHDTEKGRANDTIKNDILTQIGLPLVRFREPGKLSDTDIAKQLYAARGTNTQ